MNNLNGIVYAGGDVRIASNKNFEIVLPDGDCLITADGVETRVRAGQAIIIPPLQTFTLSVSAGTRVSVEQALLPVKGVTVADDDGSIAYALREAVKYFNCDNPKRDLVLSALGSLIVGYVNVFVSAEKYSPVVRAVADAIEKNLSSSAFSLDGFMKKFPLNYDYLRRLFKKEVGVSPREFLLNGRMELARGIILGGLSNRYSEYTVSQLAEACGFADPLYFSRVFKKYFGVSPSEYGK